MTQSLNGEEEPGAGARRPQAPDMGALVASRICHDLVNPLGAIGNGVELLMLTAGPDPEAAPDGVVRLGRGGSAGRDSPELTLIAESAAQAAARARLFRLAFGVAQPGQEIASAEMRALLADLSAGSRLSLSWDIAETVARDHARLAMLCALCLESAMAWGGTVRVSRSGGRWQIRGEAARFRDLGPLWTVFDGASGPAAAQLTASVTAAEVQFALAPRRAAETEQVLERWHGEQETRLEFGRDRA